MRIGLIEMGHWHAEMYIEALRKLGENIVAVSDRNPDVVRNAGNELDCSHYDDLRKMLRERLDFVFSFGRHCDMPEILRELIERRIPFSTEKPACIHPREIESLPRLCEEEGVFNAASLVWRGSPWVKKLREMKSAGTLGEFAHLYFSQSPVPQNAMFVGDAIGCWIKSNESTDKTFRFSTTTQYIVVRNESVKIVRRDPPEESEVHERFDAYAEFVEDTLRSFREGRKPMAELSDVHRAMEVIVRAYSCSLR
ncbi:MAG: Gfo/Idh/MocA family protein [bacterium]